MPRAPAPLSLAAARRLWLRAQRLDTPEPFGAGPAATRAAVEHLGYVQIDTINVIERSHHHILWSAASPATPAPTSATRSPSRSRSSNTGRTRSPTSRPATTASSSPTCSATAQPPRPGSAASRPSRPAPGDRPGPPRGRAHDPRHRRRRAGRQGTPLGQPQAVEARAAARLLRRHADDLRPRRHGEDLRAHRPPLRLAATAAHRHRGPDPRLPARPRAAGARRRQRRLGLLHGRPAQEGDGRARSRPASAAAGSCPWRSTA